MESLQQLTFYDIALAISLSATCMVKFAKKITRILFSGSLLFCPLLLNFMALIFSTSKFQKTGFKHHEEKTDTKFKTTSADVWVAASLSKSW